MWRLRELMKLSQDSRAHGSDSNREPVECKLQSHQQLDHSNILVSSTYRIYDVQLSPLNVTQWIMLTDCIIFPNIFSFFPHTCSIVLHVYTWNVLPFSLFICSSVVLLWIPYLIRFTERRILEINRFISVNSRLKSIKIKLKYNFTLYMYRVFFS
jgi:hypothetical protein